MQRFSLSGSGWWLIYGGSGLAAGMCFASLVAGLLFMQRSLNAPRLPTVLPASAMPTTEPLPTETPTTGSIQALLDQAQSDLAEGQAQQVIDDLLPQIDQFTDEPDQARAYEYLGQAEFQLGHFQFAAVYWENTYTIDPTPEHLYSLATAYDLGGDLEQALLNYQALLMDPDAEDYYSLAEQRIADLIDIFGSRPTPIPGLVPTPEGAVEVDLATGTGALSLPAGAERVFCFQPAEPIHYRSVDWLEFRLGGESQSGTTTLQLSPWDQSQEGSETINLVLGDNPIDFSYRYVSSDGESCATLRNVGDQTVTVENAGFILAVLAADGSTEFYGLK